MDDGWLRTVVGARGLGWDWLGLGGRGGRGGLLGWMGWWDFDVPCWGGRRGVGWAGLGWGALRRVARCPLPAAAAAAGINALDELMS